MLFSSASIASSEDTEGILTGALKTFDDLTSQMESGEICAEGPDLVQRFCQDPVQVVCDPGNRIDRTDIDERAHYRRVRTEAALRRSFPAKPSLAQVGEFYSHQSQLAFDAAGGTAVVERIFNQVRQSVSREVSNSVKLPSSQRRNISTQVNRVTLKLPQNLGVNMSLEEYQASCGRNGENPNLFYNLLDNTITICPQSIYLALESYPELPPAQALERSLFMPLAHEIGHSTHNLGGSPNVSYDLSNACYGGDQRNFPATVTQELKADFWATLGLVARMRDQRGQESKANMLRNWISRGLYGQIFCSQTMGSSQGHSPGHHRLRMIARLSEMRHLLECEPRFRGLDQTCDEGYRLPDARPPRSATRRRRR